ncbi:hypothetical protein F5Y00DRAFT_240215 [Daldinia vernicosa]|uniref:uncharacterized protein n=1 Tax=Daldinia vernicosa TaxID=114800 RepID=UPI00200838BC|nr:uncharacterized protein F5Y00DRAFT_240215 [Daldinia vernicosa]KAI0847972.1 hypothetical protein F5Y00DRAFT_240215 [Daldinia vernicosa]
MATPTPTKSMSSRLLTMKFMQRAAVASPSSPSSTTPTPDEQSSKRRKVSHIPANRDNIDSLAHIDQAAVQAAIADEERKRQEAVVQNAAKLGDAHWVLDIPEKTTNSNRGIQTPLNVVQVGFAQIDSPIDTSDAAGSDDFESTDASHIRTPMIRRYNMDNKKVSKDSESESDDSSSGSDSDNSSDDNGRGRNSYGQKSEGRSGSSRPALKSKRSAEQIKAKQFAEKRRKKEVKLNGIKSSPASGGPLSISSGGGTSQRQPMDFTCHRCGRQGHKIAQCKNTPKRPTN